MRPPCEYVVKTYIPQVRARVIKELIEKHGWGPSHVAKTLEITLTSVSKYKKILSDPTPLSQEFLDRVAAEALNVILSGPINPEAFIEVFCRNCMLHRIDGEICKLHRHYLSGIDECQACSNVYRFLEEKREERNEVISNILRSYSLLLEIPDFDKLIPEVRTNIVECVAGAKDEEDAAAFPGRLTTVKGRLVAASRPEFNASKHLANILISAHSKNGNVRGLICIRYNEEIRRAIEDSKLKFVEYQQDIVGVELSEYVAKLDEIPDVLIDLGGVGIEPVAYVFGENSVEAAKKVLRIYKRLS